MGRAETRTWPGCREAWETARQRWTEANHEPVRSRYGRHAPGTRAIQPAPIPDCPDHRSGLSRTPADVPDLGIDPGCDGLGDVDRLGADPERRCLGGRHEGVDHLRVRRGLPTGRPDAAPLRLLPRGG